MCITQLAKTYRDRKPGEIELQCQTLVTRLRTVISYRGMYWAVIFQINKNRTMINKWLFCYLPPC